MLEHLCVQIGDETRGQPFEDGLVEAETPLEVGAEVDAPKGVHASQSGVFHGEREGWRGVHLSGLIDKGEEHVEVGREQTVTGGHTRRIVEFAWAVEEKAEQVLLNLLAESKIQSVANMWLDM